MLSIGQLLLAKYNEKNLYFQTSLTTTVLLYLNFWKKLDQSNKNKL